MRALCRWCWIEGRGPHAPWCPRRVGALLAAVAVGALTACAAAYPDHVDLAAKWRPLARIQKDAATPFGVCRTVGAVVLTGSVQDFLEHDELQQDALLLHERYHAQREQETGLDWYLETFAQDRDFRWQEERAGWALQITHLVQARFPIDVATVAAILSSPYYDMVSQDEAEAWVSSVVTAAAEAR